MSFSKDPRYLRLVPAEMSISSSRDHLPRIDEDPKPLGDSTSESTGTMSMPHRKFVVKPTEISQRIRRAGAQENIENEHKGIEMEKGSVNAQPLGDGIVKKQMPKRSRRFAPQLIETARRTRKAGDLQAAVLPSDSTEANLEGDGHAPRRSGARLIAAAPYNTSIVEPIQNPLFLEIKRAASPLAHRRSRCSTRSLRSFRVPSLDPIASSESEGSNPPSLSTSPSATSDFSFMCREPTRMRESVDDRCSGYLLDLAARAAEKQLREQAMAAFPNDDHHEPVDHFIDREMSETFDGTKDVGFVRRESEITEANWELMAMRKHREILEEQKRIERERKARIEAEMNRDRVRPGVSEAPRDPIIAFLEDPTDKTNVIGGWQKDGELDQMRKGARPPMLGGDIDFPRCASPERARFDTTQRCQSLRASQCSLSEQLQSNEKRGLWCGVGSGRIEPPSHKSSTSCLWSNSNSRSASRNGLWGGVCAPGSQSSAAPASQQTGLLTPKIEIENKWLTLTPHSTPARPAATSSLSLFAVTAPALPPPPPPPPPLSPPISNPDITVIDSKLSFEAALAEEFTDDFVTQVYNYLSLGYPSIARNFDDELSKISGISIEELRQDDHLVEKARGYIRLGEDGNLKDTDITEETCAHL